MARKLTGWRGNYIIRAAGLAITLAVVAGIALTTDAGQPAASSAGTLGPGQAGPRSAVPWRLVGVGWVLAEYWPGRGPWDENPKAARPTLYLIDPTGGRYRLRTWPVTKNPPSLVDWSADKTRAVLRQGGTFEQVVLATGRIRQFRLSGKTDILGYTRPRGQSLLGWRQAGSRVQISRYDLAGHRTRILATSSGALAAVYSGTGAMLAVTGSHGVRLIRSNGSAIRNLRVPGASAAGCSPWRWWDAGTVLASCVARGTSRGRLWLVPADGSRPTMLTPQDSGHNAGLNEIGAWRLPEGLYLQTAASSGNASIFRQAAHGRARLVTVPGPATSHWILAARGPRLLLSAMIPCSGTASLLWFNPSTGREDILIKTPRNVDGVLGAVPYGQPTAPTFIAFGCVG